MRISRIRGTIRLRALINFRVDAQLVQRLLPAPLRVRAVEGCATFGICLIRLERMRPSLLGQRSDAGLASDNVAYRISVEWTDELSGRTSRGVFIPRRDTSSSLQQVLGRRFFAGDYHVSRVRITDEGPSLTASVRSGDGTADIELRAVETDQFPSTSAFGSLTAASQFFEEGALGYSTNRRSEVLDVLELLPDRWEVTPLKVEHVQTSFVERGLGLDPRSVVLDNALLMRDVPHSWRRVTAPRPS